MTILTNTLFSRFTALHICIYAAALIAVSGCSGINLPNRNVENYNRGAPQVAAPPDTVTALLADAADRAAVALETLSAVEHARSPGVSVAPVSNAPMELRRAITIDWVGPVEPIMQSLANRAGYSAGVVGTSPPVPIIISLDVQNKPVIEALRDVGLQMGVRADITVDSARRVVEIHYPPVPGLGQTF